MVENDNKITRILIAYDGSGYSHASLDELQRGGMPPEAEVLIISVSEIWLPIPVKSQKTAAFPDTDVAEYFKKHREQSERNLTETNAVVSQAREELLRFFPEWNIKTEAVAGSPAREILSRALEFNPDFIVVGAQGLSSDRETGLGSISQKVLAGAQCSVRISRLKPNTARSRLKIMIGFDNSPGAMEVVKTVAFRTWKSKPEIRLVIVTDPFVLLMPGRVLQPIPGMSEGKMKGEQKWVETLAANALQVLSDAGFPATLHIYSGNPRMILVREAENWGADSVFVGANSHESQPDFYSPGCVASAIAARASCSVEVVRQVQ